MVHRPTTATRRVTRRRGRRLEEVEGRQGLGLGLDLLGRQHRLRRGQRRRRLVRHVLQLHVQLRIADQQSYLFWVFDP